MNLIANIWKHPKTSAAGVLIAISTVAGVLSQPGVTLGTAEPGTIVSLVGAAATALLGLLARDPGRFASQQVSEAASRRIGADQSTGAKLSVWMLVALLVSLPWSEGCAGSSVAQDIVNWTPSLQSAVSTVDSASALLAPADAPVFSAATAGFDAASNLLSVQAKAYLANPGATTLAQLQAQVVTFEQQANAALLAAAKIVNPASQQHALAVIQAVATIVTAILALVQSVSSKVAVAQMAAESSIKLAAVQPYLNRARATALVAAHYHEPSAVARMQIEQTERNALEAGF